MNQASRNKLGHKGFGLALVPMLVLLALAPAPMAAVASESQERAEAAATETPVPLPRACPGISPPDQPPPACCIFGYIYNNDLPVDGASVQIDSLHGTRVITTGLGWASDDPYYVADLSDTPLEASPGDVITITASYDGMVSVRTWTVQSSGQQVDLGLIDGYQATGSAPDLLPAWRPMGMGASIDKVATDDPVVGLTAANDSPTILGQPTMLTATITAGTNVTYTWTFGDGSTGSGVVVTHTYPTAGTYTAVVTATNATSVVTASTDVSIANIIVPNDYATIQQAVNAASPSDVVFVRTGTYTENVTIAKALTLQGEDRETTIVDGNGGDVIYVTADSVIIAGLTVRNGNHGIYLYQADNCEIRDVTATSNVWVGLNIRASTYNTVSDSVSAYNETGINLDDEGSHHNTFQNVDVYSNTNYGLIGYAGSDYTKILDSRIYDNGFHGVAIGWSQHWSIEDSDIYSNTNAGISIDTAGNGTIRNNLVYLNYYGLNFTGSGTYYNTVEHNRIYSNTEGITFWSRVRYNTIRENEIYGNDRGVHINWNPGADNYDNTFLHNIFTSNAVHTLVGQYDYANTWDSGYPAGGNYWDDHPCTDGHSGPDQDQPGGDGLCDAAYVVTPTLNTDHYPLVAVIIATSDTSTQLGSATTLTATAMATIGDTYTYTWAFGDDQTGSGPIVTHTYLSPGMYTAVVTASNSTELFTRVFTATTVVTVTQDDPLSAVSITGPATGLVSASCTFTATVSPSTAALPITYTWQATGQTPVVHTDSLYHSDSVTFTWAMSGTQFITVTASNALGSVVATKTTSISYPPPSVAFTATPLTGTTPLDVQFTDQSTGDIVSWDWTFGDDGASGARHPAHTYTVSGTYTATLSVAGPGGSALETKASYIDVYPAETWTLMLYFAGDNDLYHLLYQAIDAMKQVASDPNVNILVLWDGHANNDTQVYRVQQGIAFPIAVGWNPGELNTGEPQTLIDFVKWARTNYPADHYFLSIANHGRGTSGIAWDNTVPQDRLIPYEELGSALDAITSSGSDKIDVLFLDACLMGLIEDAYEVKDYVDYLVVSENLGWSVFAYDSYVSSVTGNTPPRELAVDVASAYFAALRDLPGTVSVLDMSAVETVGNTTDAMAQTLIDYIVENPSSNIPVIKTIRMGNVQVFDSRNYLVLNREDDEYIDLYDFAAHLITATVPITVQERARDVTSAVANCVIAEHHQSGTDPWSGEYWNLDGSHGIAIYYPPAPGGWDYDNYTAAGNWQFCQSTMWDEFLGHVFKYEPPEPPVNPGIPPMPDANRIFLPFVTRGG